MRPLDQRHVRLRRTSSRTASLTAAALSVILITGCSSSAGLNAEQRVEAESLVMDRASSAMIELSDEDRDCVVDELTPGDLDGARNDAVAPLADVVVSCVGDELIGASVLRAQTVGISEASLDCAVQELDRRFVVDLVAGAMNGAPPRAQAEIEVARVLAVCLDLDELL